MAKKTTTTKAFESVTKINMRAKNAVIKVRDLVEGYEDNSLNDEGGITSMNGRLNIRPKYQRSYIADMKPMWRENLINSILCGFPINRIYIGVDKADADEKSFTEWALEMLDGQQRTKTICDYVKGKFSIVIDGCTYYFHNLTKEEQETILDYALDVTYCIGSESARIAWFKRINQPNSILVPQELRNATYVGEWLEDAKKFFSATSGNARKQINDKEDKYCACRYSSGRSIERSEYLELAIDWIAYDKYADLRGDKKTDDRIIRYMAEHQHDTNADELKNHYKAVIDWANDVFFHNGFPKPKEWQSIQHQDWGMLYAEYKDKKLTEEEKIHISERSREIIGYGAAIYQKSDGVYEWVLRGERDDEINTYLHLRNFSDEDRMARYNAQKGIDPIDGKHYEMSEMDAHHLKSWKNGGDSKYDNLVWLSKKNHKDYHAGDLNITADDLRKMRDELCKK